MAWHGAHDAGAKSPPFAAGGWVQIKGAGRGGHVELAITEKGRTTLVKTFPAWRAAQDKVVAILGREHWSNVIRDLKQVAAELKQQ